MGAPVITFTNVSKRYGEGERAVWALSDVDLSLGPAEFVSIIGPSGSGKSTLLNLAGGLDVASRGTVVVGERDIAASSVSERAALRRDTVAMVFQFANLIEVLDVEQNVGLPLRAAHLATRTIATRVAAALEAVGLAKHGDRYPNELSGGELQRVGIARALVTEAPVILADEPTGSLDTVRGEAILEILRDAVDKRGRTVVLVTHDLQAASYGDRIVTLRDGRVVDEVDGAGSQEVIPLRRN